MKQILKTTFFLIVLATSCSEIPTDLPDPVIPTEGRVMLIEELTGVSCSPCASAALLLNQILEDANGAIVAYAVHGDFQSEPHSDSKYDFRYPDAKDLELSLSYLGKPAASFNRVIIDGFSAQSFPNTWQPIIDDELVKPQVLDIALSSNFDSGTRQVNINVGVSALQDIPGNLNLHVVISESHLVDPQNDQGGNIIPDFDHKHVMKSKLTAFDGDFLVSNISSGETVPKPFTYTIPAENNGEWLPENMEITAFVTASDLNGEVQQAAQIHLIE